MTIAGNSLLKSQQQASSRMSNPRVSPSHSVVTALAQGSKRRAAGRAGYAQRWTYWVEA